VRIDRATGERESILPPELRGESRVYSPALGPGWSWPAPSRRVGWRSSIATLVYPDGDTVWGISEHGPGLGTSTRLRVPGEPKAMAVKGSSLYLAEYPGGTIGALDRQERYATVGAIDDSQAMLYILDGRRLARLPIPD